MTFNKLMLPSAVLFAFAAVPAVAQDKVDYNKQVRPILATACYSCHAGDKDKGDLKLDSVEAYTKGGESGPPVVAGDPAKSDLYRRITLPAGHDDIMPPKGDPLKKEQTDLVALWITQGASFGDWKADDAATIAAATGAKQSTEAPLPVVAAADPAALDKLRAAGAGALPLAQGVNLIDVTFGSSAANVADAQLALLAPVATQVYGLNLANTKITDAGLAQLAPLTNLRRLHLEKTGLTDAGLAHLKGLAALEYLNLYGTAVTDAGLAHLEGLKNLKKVYLWQSKVTDAGVDKLKKALPTAMIDTGWKEPTTAPTAAATPAK